MTSPSISTADVIGDKNRQMGVKNINIHPLPSRSNQGTPGADAASADDEPALEMAEESVRALEGEVGEG